MTPSYIYTQSIVYINVCKVIHTPTIAKRVVLVILNQLELSNKITEMKAALISLGVIFLGGLFIGSIFMGSYNGLVVQNQNVDTAWAQVESQYQRRFDLIPNLVGAVKGTMAQEQAVFGAIANARAHYANAGTTNDKVQATNQYESAISRLLVVMENYPQLKSIDTVNRLMDELSGTENRVQVSRDRYNESVRIFDTQIKSFPTNVLAGMFGFTARDYFQSDEAASKAPVVDLKLN